MEKSLWTDAPDRPGFYWVSRPRGEGPGRITTFAEVYYGPRNVLFAQVLGYGDLPHALDWSGCWKGVRWQRVPGPEGQP